MPLHRHECEICGYRFRVLEHGNSPCEPAVCPACGSERSQRLLPRVAVQFKGSGYYKTDHARSSEKSGSPDRKEPISTVTSEPTDP